MPGLLPFLGEVALRSSLLLIAVFLVLGVMRQASASQRHFVLILGLAIAALIPAGLLLSPKLIWTVPVPAQVQSQFTPLKATATLSPENPEALSPISPTASDSEPSLLGLFTWNNLLIGVLSAGMLVQALTLAQAAWTWRRIRLRATKMPLLADVLEKARAFAGTSKIPPILASETISVPVLCGSFQPVIILPSDAKDWPPARLLMSLCHELAHYRRRDSWLLPLLCIVRVLYWWNPLVWLALSHLRRERENACDDSILNHNFRATDYAELIIDAARRAHEFRWPSGSLAMAFSSNVSARITAILNPALNRRATNRGVVIIGLVVAIALGWFLAAAQVEAEVPPAVSHALKSQIQLDFALVEIDEKTYQQQAATIDAAIKNGNIAFLANLRGASLVSSPSVTTQAGTKADISIGKVLIDGDKSTPVTTLTATSVLGKDGKVVPSVVKSESQGPSKMPLGVDFQTTPSIATDGTIVLPIRYRVGYMAGNRGPDDFYMRTSTTDQKLSVADSQATGFWVNAEGKPGSMVFPYSLMRIINSPSDQEIKSLPPPSPSPNRLAIIVHARLVLNGAEATPINHPKSYVQFRVVLVNVDEVTYQRNAPAMDQAVREGNLRFFDHPKDGWILRTFDINLLPGQPGWFSQGTIQSYIQSATQEMRNGKPYTTRLQAAAVFLGLNVDFSWSKDKRTVDTAWQITEPVSYTPLTHEKMKSGAIFRDDLPEAQFHVTAYKDKGWDMAPGPAHAYWVGQTFGVLHHTSMAVDEMIKTRTPSRLAAFLTAETVSN